MTIKKYYQKGKLVSVGFDSLKEVFVYQNNPDLLEEIPSNELILKEGLGKAINDDPEYKKFRKSLLL